jgi:hypothetical protein
MDHEFASRALRRCRTWNVPELGLIDPKVHYLMVWKEHTSRRTNVLGCVHLYEIQVDHPILQMHLSCQLARMDKQACLMEYSAAHLNCSWRKNFDASAYRQSALLCCFELTLSPFKESVAATYHMPVLYSRLSLSAETMLDEKDWRLKSTLLGEIEYPAHFLRLVMKRQTGWLARLAVG